MKPSDNLTPRAFKLKAESLSSQLELPRETIQVQTDYMRQLTADNQQL